MREERGRENSAARSAAPQPDRREEELEHIPVFRFCREGRFSRFFPGRVLFSVFSRLLLLEREYILIASVTKIIQDILL